MRVGIVGGGTVGRALARAYVEHAETRVYDLDPRRRTHPLPDVLECDVIFLALPTPGTPGGCLDVSALEGFCREHRGRRECFVVRSTTPVGTTRRLREQYGLANLVHSPEFLTARCAAADAHLPARNIIGGHACECAARLTKLYTERFPGVPVLTMSSDESEAVKLIQNGFFGVKLSFFNEARSLCDRLGLKWDAVLAGVLSDGRIAHSHTRVPGPDLQFGWGGDCLVKDAECLAGCIEGARGLAAVTRAALGRNRSDRGQTA